MEVQIVIPRQEHPEKYPLSTSNRTLNVLSCFWKQRQFRDWKQPFSINLCFLLELPFCPLQSQKPGNVRKAEAKRQVIITNGRRSAAAGVFRVIFLDPQLQHDVFCFLVFNKEDRTSCVTFCAFCRQWFTCFFFFSMVRNHVNTKRKTYKCVCVCWRGGLWSVTGSVLSLSGSSVGGGADLGEL